MSEKIDFKSDFIKTTKEILCKDNEEMSSKFGVTLEINILLAMISLPIEQTKFKKRNAERRFFEPCVNFLKENSEISIGIEKKDRYIMMDLRDAIAHLHIETQNEDDEIEYIILKNEFHNEINFECKIKREKLREFVLLVADEYEKYCDKINILSNR